MKRIVIGMLALASFIFSASAQQTRKMKHQKSNHAKGMMVKALNLSAAQKEQMKANRLSTKKQLVDLNKNEDITVRDYKARKKAIKVSQKEQMNKLLTTEQKDKIAQNNINRKAKQDLKASKKLGKMKASLNLSDDQVSKIKANREAGHAKGKAIKENSQLSQSQKKEQLMTLKQTQKDNIAQLLTSEQTRKIAEKKKARMDKTGKK